MRTTRFSALLEKSYSGELSEEESIEYFHLLTTLPEEEVMKAIDETIDVDMAATFDKERIFGTVVSETYGTVKAPVAQGKWKKHTAIAACILLLVGLSIFKFYTDSEGGVDHSDRSVHQDQVADINLPDEYVTVTLDDGRVVVISDSIDKWAEGGLSVQRVGSEVYSLGIEATDEPNAVFHTFSTPKGVSSQVILPDGTKVWLNSASAIKISSLYNMKDRIVELWGEVYIEVKSAAAKPFVTKTRQTKVEVLGTHFNVLALPNEPYVQTTLSSGSVRINQLSNKVRLLPGEQATTFDDRAKIDKRNVDIDQVLAWKDGYFKFTDQPISIVLNELLRWYDVDDIVWENRSNEHFTASLTRSRSLSEVLKKLELISDMQFEIKERRIIVK